MRSFVSHRIFFWTGGFQIWPHLVDALTQASASESSQGTAEALAIFHAWGVEGLNGGTINLHRRNMVLVFFCTSCCVSNSFPVTNPQLTYKRNLNATRKIARVCACVSEFARHW